MEDTRQWAPARNVTGYLTGLGVTGVGVAALLATLFGVAVVGQRGGDLSEQDRSAVERIVRASILPGVFVEVCDTQVFGRTALASLDYTGRHFCNRIVRIDLVNGRFVDEIEAYHVSHLEGVVQDLDGDGRAELIVPQAFSLFEGHTRCQAVVPVVYACSLERCSEANGHHPGFFQQQIEDRQRQLASPGYPEDDAYSGRLECLAIERDKMLRETLQDPRAGVANAGTWMRSPDPIVRRKAISVFEQIGDDAARAALGTLANDPDQVTREAARRAMSTIR